MLMLKKSEFFLMSRGKQQDIDLLYGNPVFEDLLFTPLIFASMCGYRVLNLDIKNNARCQGVSRMVLNSENQ
jgi:hypothetical protein